MAAKAGFIGASERPKVLPIFLNGLHFFLPLALITFLLLQNYSPLLVGAAGCAAVVAASMLRAHTRVGFTEIVAGLRQGARLAVPISVACAVAGIVVGTIGQTGIGLQFTESVVSLSDGRLWLALILVAVAALILGMGLPATAAYIVLAVMTGEDLVEPGNQMLGSGEGAMALKDVVPMVMSQGKVLFHSQAVAAVAATSPELAAEAAQAVEVVYDVLPAVTVVHKALAADAPILHDDRFPDGYPEEPTNLATHISLTVGDPVAAFEKADVVIKQTYSVPMCHQGYIEPHACVARADAAGRVELWCCTQGHFTVRHYTSAVTGIDLGKIKVTASEIGGGFGGKTTVYLEPLAVVLAQKSGRPVKMVMDRGDVFRATGPAPGAETKVKLGATRDGKLVAAEVECLMDSGAYNGNPAGIPAFMATASYKLTDARSTGRSV